MAVRELEVPLDGPTVAFGEWNRKERKRRSAALKILSQLYLAAMFPVVLKTCGLPTADLGLFYAAALAFCLFGFVAPTALNQVPDVRHHALATALGLVLCGWMKALAVYFSVRRDAGTMPLGFFLSGLAALITYSFVGWCLAIPHRDLASRRYAIRVMRWKTDPPSRLLFADFWTFFACAVLLAFPHPLAPFFLMCGACLVGMALKVWPWDLVRVTWRAIVLWFTYEVPRTHEPHIYTFVNPFRDLRLRVLLSMLTMALASVMLCHWLERPEVFQLKAAWSSGIYGLLFTLTLWSIRLAIGALTFVAWALLAITAVGGPLGGYVYKEFAKEAVEEAEYWSEALR